MSKERELTKKLKQPRKNLVRPKGKSRPTGQPVGQPEVYTKDVVLELIKQCHEWLKKPTNFYYSAFFTLELGLGGFWIKDMLKKFPELRIEFEALQKVTEDKIVKGALDTTSTINPGFAKFYLNCKSGYVPKTEQDLNVTDKTVNFEFGKPKTDNDDKE